jgi:hypothetical protein
MDISTRQRHLLYASLAAIAVFTGTITLGSGFTTLTAEGTCYTKQVQCHGIPLSDCIGVTSTDISYKDASACTQLANITEECKILRQPTCRVTSASGNEWKKKTSVQGRSCAAWDEAYSLDLKPCPD